MAYSTRICMCVYAMRMWRFNWSAGLVQSSRTGNPQEVTVL